jgi:putative membrane protein
LSIVNKRVAAAGVTLGLALTPAAAPAAVHEHSRSADHRACGHHGVPRDITDAQFLAKAARSNRFEIVTGTLAQQRAAKPAIKELGAMFVRDHTAALNQGAAVAQTLGIAVPAGLSRAQRAQVDRLTDLRGRRFDRAWLKAQIRAHVKAVHLHVRGAVRGDSQAVRDLALAGLPVVTRHLSELVQLRRGAQAGDRHS